MVQSISLLVVVFFTKTFESFSPLSTCSETQTLLVQVVNKTNRIDKMILTFNSWKQHFLSLSGNEEANRNMSAFSFATSSANSKNSKINAIVEDIDSVILTADAEMKIQIFTTQETLEAPECALQTK